MTDDQEREQDQAREQERAQERERDQERLALEKQRERYVWYYLAYFLFGIHLIAFVMIYAVKHAG